MPHFAPPEKDEELGGELGGSSSCPLGRTPLVAAASAVEGSGVWPCGILILQSGSSPLTSKYFHSEDATTPISSSSRMNLHSVGEAWRPLREETVDVRLGVLCVALLGKLWFISMLP